MSAQAVTGKAASSMNAEGQKAAAQHLWNSILTKCGDAWYYSSSKVHLLGVGEGAGWIWSHKGVRFTLSALTVSPAEALNGVSWEGLATMHWAARRRSIDGKWGEWQAPEPITESGGYQVLIKKVNGQWLYQGAFAFDERDPNIRGDTWLDQVSAANLASTAKPSCDAAGNVEPPASKAQQDTAASNR
ncbi:MAG TPA: hypothetical protein VG759_17685 [Candidatus Angelobacter sp.]|jgi:hypothetical protein|nr:hypothetical protein [Candidatus Angelobacter sp.]